MTAKFGDVLYNKLTEEPAFVIHAFKHFTFVRRPVMGQKGISYRLAFFLSSELETLAEQTARTIANIQSRQAIAGIEFDPGVQQSTKSN
jgi:hypothetical protein